MWSYLNTILRVAELFGDIDMIIICSECQKGFEPPFDVSQPDEFQKNRMDNRVSR